MAVIMCESKLAVERMPKILEQVPGIGVVLIGVGDLSQDLGRPQQFGHPDVVAAVDEVVAACKHYKVAVGTPNVNADNVEEQLAKGFDWLMARTTTSFTALERGLKASGR